MKILFEFWKLLFDSLDVGDTLGFFYYIILCIYYRIRAIHIDKGVEICIWSLEFSRLGFQITSKLLYCVVSS